MVWNRACEGASDSALAGDRALASLLLLHGLTMNGGLLHAVEVLTGPAAEAAKEGFRFFGLGAAADAVGWAHDAFVALDMDDFDAAERLEEEANRRYYEAVPDDSILERHFRSQFARRPEVFAAPS